KQRDQAPYPTAIVNEERGMIEGLRRSRIGVAAACALAGLMLLLLASLNLVGKPSAFFGAGTMLLLALLLGEHALLGGRAGGGIQGSGFWAVSRLGFRNTTYRAGRSILCIALIASAAFIIVAVESFKRSNRDPGLDRKSGSGGSPLLAESQLPLYHDPNTPDG